MYTTSYQWDLVFNVGNSVFNFFIPLYGNLTHTDYKKKVQKASYRRSKLINCLDNGAKSEMDTEVLKTLKESYKAQNC